MILLNEKVYYGAKASKRKLKWKNAVKKCNKIPGVYLLTDAGTSENQLEIHELPELSQAGLHYRDYRVFGIAIGRDEALELLRSITQEAYDCTGTADLKSYLGIQE